MKFTTLIALTTVFLLTNEVEAVSLQQTLIHHPHGDVMAQLEVAAQSKGFFDFLKKAGDWIKGAVHKVGSALGIAAQVSSRAYVNELAAEHSLNLPRLSLAQMEKMGFNKNAFAQMDVQNMTPADLHQVILLGLADQDINDVAFAQVHNRPHGKVMSQLQSAAQSKGFFDFLKKAGDWIKGAVTKVASAFGGAQVSSRAYVNHLAQVNGITLPKLTLAQMKQMGFNKHAFAQMDISNMTPEDTKQVILLGLADEDVDVSLAQVNHIQVLSQLKSAAQAKGFFDFLKKAGDWIKGAVTKVASAFGAAQVSANAYVHSLAQEQGITLPKLSLAEINQLGFNKHAFAQMDLTNMTPEDVHQVVLLGLANENVDASLAQVNHMQVLSQLKSAAHSKGFFDFLKKAGDWIKGAVTKVGHAIGLAAQKDSRAYVNSLAQEQGITLPKLSLAEIKKLGFNKKAFAQMNVENMTRDDLHQVILLGLANEDVKL